MNSAPYKQQSGLALLVFVIALALASIAYFLSGVSADEQQIKQQQTTREALTRAKQALLAYAMNYTAIEGTGAEGPGKLPCPDTNDDGAKDLGCNAFIESPGRLPYRDLGIDDLRDGNNERLWYAVSNNFGTAGVTIINTATTGRITLKNRDGSLSVNDGAGPDGVIAVIISPGKTLVRQDGYVQKRTTNAERLDPRNYLDIAFVNTANEEDNVDFENGDSVNGLMPGPVRDAAGNIIINDMIEIITYADMAAYMHAKVAGDIADAVTAFRSNCGYWPEATPFDSTQLAGSFVRQAGNLQGHLPVDDNEWDAGGCAEDLLPEWIVNEEWHLNSYYATASTADCAPGVDCLTVNNTAAPNNDKQAIIVFSGRHGLPAPGSSPSDYFEGENDNTVQDSVFDAGEPEDFVWVLAP